MRRTIGRVLVAAATTALLAAGCGDSTESTSTTTTADVAGGDIAAWADQLREAEQGLVDAALDVADAALASLDAPADGDAPDLPQVCDDARAAIEPLRDAADDAPDEELSSLVDDAADSYDEALATCGASADFDVVAFNQQLLDAAASIEEYQARLQELVQGG